MSQTDYSSAVAIPSQIQGHFPDMMAEKVVLDLYPDNFSIHLHAHSAHKLDSSKPIDLTDSEVPKPKRSRRERLKNRLIRGSSSSSSSEVFVQEWNLHDSSTAHFMRGNCWRELALDPQICSALEQSVIAATRIGKHLQDLNVSETQSLKNSHIDSNHTISDLFHLRCIIKPGLIRIEGYLKVESISRFSKKSLFSKSAQSSQPLIQIEYQWDGCAQLQQPQTTIGELEILSNELLTELTQLCQGRLGLIARLLGPKKSHSPIPERFANLLWA
ncbi:MAG: hypothetical protein V4629_06015 [Pseudomonadota bacterium]